jgi:hypothetical protein
MFGCLFTIAEAAASIIWNLDHLYNDSATILLKVWFPQDPRIEGKGSMVI